MKTVWVVEVGSYSDYHVVGLFSTKENADKVYSVLSVLDNARVSEWPIDPGITDLNQGRTPYWVVMQRDGLLLRLCESDWSDALNVGQIPHIERPLTYPGGIITGVVFATDEEHAIKIMNEIRAQYIADGLWPE